MTTLSKVVEFAESIHGKELKNGVPFLYHPMAVASLVLKYGGSQEQMLAALLHDTICSENATEQKLAQLFGEKVAALTYTFADPPLPKEASWRATKQAYLDKVATLAEEKLLLVGCEELHEIEELLYSLKYVGVKTWERYPVHGMEVTWYFRELFSILYKNLKTQRALVSEFSTKLKILKDCVFEGEQR